MAGRGGGRRGAARAGRGAAGGGHGRRRGPRAPRRCGRRPVAGGGGRGRPRRRPRRLAPVRPGRDGRARNGPPALGRLDRHRPTPPARPPTVRAPPGAASGTAPPAAGVSGPTVEVGGDAGRGVGAVPSPAGGGGGGAAHVELVVDPGRAFGSGSHASTRLALAGLVDADPARRSRVVDVGCGSGVLALAALALGASEAVAVDTDPAARAATEANAERAGLRPRLTIASDVAEVDPPADLVAANILAPVLVELASDVGGPWPPAASWCSPGSSPASVTPSATPTPASTSSPSAPRTAGPLSPSPAPEPNSEQGGTTRPPVRKGPRRQGHGPEPPVDGCAAQSGSCVHRARRARPHGPHVRTGTAQAGGASSGSTPSTASSGRALYTWGNSSTPTLTSQRRSPTVSGSSSSPSSGPAPPKCRPSVPGQLPPGRAVHEPLGRHRGGDRAGRLGGGPVVGGGDVDEVVVARLGLRHRQLSVRSRSALRGRCAGCRRPARRRRRRRPGRRRTTRAATRSPPPRRGRRWPPPRRRAPPAAHRCSSR